jgi:uncharacterized protein (TIGR03066 family)
MNSIRLFAVGAIACLLCLTVQADEKKDIAKMVVGKWEASKTDEGTIPVGTKVEFTKDGKMSVKGKQGEQVLDMTGTYKVDGDKIEMTLKNGDMEFTHSITVTKITKDMMETKNDNGQVVELKKAK